MTTSSGPTPAKMFDRTTPPHILTLVLMTGLATLNMNMVLPSLPSLADWFSEDYAVVQLAISAYLAMTAVLQLFIGPMSDRFGRRPVVLASFGLFLVATIGCLFAPSFETFLAFRLIQASVASSIALSRAIVRDMVPPEEAASMIGYVTMGMAVAPMIGPMIGGVLDQIYGWHAVFWMTFIFGAFVYAMLWLDLGETNDHRTADFGAQFRAMPELATSRRFWGYSGTAALASGAFFAFLGGGPFVATQILGLSSASLGAYFGMIALGYMLGNFISGRYARRIGMNRMMLLGTVFSTFGTAFILLLFMLGFVSAPIFFSSMLLVGFGNGMTLPSANAGMVSVRPHLAGSASGLGGAMMIGGGAALSALAGALLHDDSGAWPLLYIMLASTFLAILCALDVARTAKRKGELGIQ